MPALTHARREAFAQHLAGGKTATLAYELAGYKPDDLNAFRMAERGDIQLRLQELTAKVAENSAITTESLIKDCRTVLTMALESGQTAGAVAAIKEIGVLSGRRIERRESGQPGEFEAIEKMSAEDLRAFLGGVVLEDEDEGDGTRH